MKTNRKMLNILIVDDDTDICLFLSKIFAQEGYEVKTAYTGSTALSILSQHYFDIVFVDLHLSDMSGLKILQYVKENSNDTQVIIITGYATIKTAVEAIKKGAYDYLTKPVSVNNVRIICLRVIEKVSLMEEIEVLRKELDQTNNFYNIVGKSPKIRQIMNLIKQTSVNESNVLITGESGTGKELIARTIHYYSKRSKKRFVAINCGAIAKDLIESELFGHVKGAYTGAISNKIGFFELASGGTILLDEITETVPEFQVKLLRVLQEGEFYRVGSSRLIEMNARIIASSNQDIEKLIQQNKFRKDLFYRLNVISLHIPPLRERKEDIPLITGKIINNLSAKLNKKITIDHEAMMTLTDYPFPGNVRELENALEFAVNVAQSNTITLSELPKSIISKKVSFTPTIGSLKEALYQYEKFVISNALKMSNCNISKAARQLQIHRQSLQQKIQKLSIDLNSL